MADLIASFLYLAGALLFVAGNVLSIGARLGWW
jgi:hypothetical protein